MDVVNVEQARIAEEAGAVALMALERVGGYRKDGVVSLSLSTLMIKMIKEAVTIPVMAKARILGILWKGKCWNPLVSITSTKAKF